MCESKKTSKELEANLKKTELDILNQLIERIRFEIIAESKNYEYFKLSSVEIKFYINQFEEISVRLPIH